MSFVKKEKVKNHLRLNRPKTWKEGKRIVRGNHKFLHCHSIIISFCERRHFMHRLSTQPERRSDYEPSKKQAAIRPRLFKQSKWWQRERKMHEIIQSWIRDRNKCKERETIAVHNLCCSVLHMANRKMQRWKSVVCASEIVASCIRFPAEKHDIKDNTMLVEKINLTPTLIYISTFFY